MSDLTDNPTPDLPAEPDGAPDMVAPLGAVAYGLFVLNEPGSLEELSTLAESHAARIPTQDGRLLDRDGFQEKLLDELGALDL
jgi:hypothetical protein